MFARPDEGDLVIWGRSKAPTTKLNDCSINRPRGRTMERGLVLQDAKEGVVCMTAQSKVSPGHLSHTYPALSLLGLVP
jgi:hypothetical protein